jgi:cell wall-associated NlpC family hydrolase
MRFLRLATLTLLLAGCAAGPPATTPSVGQEDVASDASSPLARELALNALSHVGTPYVAGGNSPDRGFDCSGLVQYVFGRGAGVALPRTAEQMSTVGTPVKRSDLRPGDLVFFNTLRRPFSHVGIYVGNQRFIHAPTSGGVVEIVDLRRAYWQTRFNGARRLAM